ncbi:hypothetical protein [Nannocystis pusilla]|uniref:hypothetical protein n=1 Tax=Nannocystis pusilla TaxID=889268 RepID=UPI003B81D8A5
MRRRASSSPASAAAAGRQRPRAAAQPPGQVRGGRRRRAHDRRHAGAAAHARRRRHGLARVGVRHHPRVRDRPLPRRSQRPGRPALARRQDPVQPLERALRGHHQRSGRAPQIRYYTERDEAIARATTLDRVRVGRVSALQRGPDAVYFATVVGQRNPIDRDLLAPQSGDEWDRGQGRDLSVFSRWVGIFVRATQSAEQTFAIKTVPGFYLVSS